MEHARNGAAVPDCGNSLSNTGKTGSARDIKEQRQHTRAAAEYRLSLRNV